MRGSRDSVELTAQEEAVTSLAARGLSNREVAAELYISVKTVQYHLTRIYAKLGTRSRAEPAGLGFAGPFTAGPPTEIDMRYTTCE